MNRKLFVRILSVLTVMIIAIILLVNNKKRPNTSQRLPNIIFIMADDMGYGDVEALNPGSKIPTPNMNRIAEEGMFFSDAHSYSGVCTPTRYGVLTGRCAFRTRLASGVLGGHSVSLIEPGRETVATLLQTAGYRTACVGKWHLGLDFKKKDPDKPLTIGNEFSSVISTANVDYTASIDGGPCDHGFDYSYIFPASLDMQPYIYISNKKVVNTDLEHIDGVPQRTRELFWRHGDAEKDFEFTDVLPRLTRHAMGFIRDHHKSSPAQPFFLYFPMTAPHLPYVPRDDFHGTSQAGAYGDFVHQVDSHIGEIMDLLDSLGIRQNTLLIVTSDNGARWHPEDITNYDHRANYHFRGMKADVWEGGHRVAFLVRWPDVIPGGTSSDRLVCHNDLIATCAELTGQRLDWNAGEDSYSYLSALTGEITDRAERYTMINQASSTTLSLRQDNWKLILDRSSGGWSSAEITEGPPMQLYNLDEDIGEQNNLFDSMPGKIHEMQSLLEMYKREGRSRFR